MTERLDPTYVIVSKIVPSFLESFIKNWKQKLIIETNGGSTLKINDDEKKKKNLCATTVKIN